MTLAYIWGSYTYTHTHTFGYCVLCAMCSFFTYSPLVVDVIIVDNVDFQMRELNGDNVFSKQPACIEYTYLTFTYRRLAHDKCSATWKLVMMTWRWVKCLGIYVNGVDDRQPWQTAFDRMEHEDGQSMTNHCKHESHIIVIMYIFSKLANGHSNNNGHCVAWGRKKMLSKSPHRDLKSDEVDSSLTRICEISVRIPAAFNRTVVSSQNRQNWHRIQINF